MSDKRSKEELLTVLKESYPLTEEYEKVKVKYLKKNKPHLMIIAYPFLVALVIYLMRDVITLETLTNPYVYGGILLGWLAVFYLQVPLIGRNLRKEKETKARIEKEFVEITGLHRKLCNKLKVQLMIEAIENGASNYHDALLHADRRYKTILVEADRK